LPKDFPIGKLLMRYAVASIGSMHWGSNSLIPALMLRSGAEFRTRLVEGHAEEQLLTVMLTLFKERGWLKARGKQRTDSTHVLAKIRAIHRLVCVGETLRHALNCLAILAPEWLLAHSQPEWVDRYGVRLEDSRLPSGEEDRQTWARSGGQDGAILLQALFEPGAPAWLAEVPAVELLRRVWVQN
jgi:transposase